jgi:hypothetical protein
MNTINQIVPEPKSIHVEALSALTSKEYPIGVFDPLIVDFLDALSKGIMKNRQINRNPGLTALGFWLRSANIRGIIFENAHLVNPAKYRLRPLGVVFHICPANVDTMFLYSMALSMLTGNKNILRLSSKIESPDMLVLFDIIRETLNVSQFELLKPYLNIFQYEHNDDISAFLSMQANGRIVWGGDNTVKLFKSFPTKGRTKDIFFPDRISYAIFDAAKFNTLGEDNQKELVRKFYNDSYIFDQKGCSSPQVLFIYGNKDDASNFKQHFYNLLNTYSSANYQNDIFSLAMLKLNHLISDIFDESIKTNDVIKKTNYLYFVDIDSPSENMESCGGGYFYIKQINTIEEIVPFIHVDVQTLSYFELTLTDLEKIVQIGYGKGIDRIVPVGEALTFEYIWDGYNLLDELCLKTRIK